MVRGLDGEKMRKKERLERKKNIRHFRDIEVYRRAFDAAMQIVAIDCNVKFNGNER
jgi:hypothetical protein